MIAKTGATQLPTASVWFTAQLSAGFSAKWQWYNDVTYKTMKITPNAYQRFYRTGIRYQFSKEWNAAGGVGFFSTNTSTDKQNDEFGKEFRLWQELNYQHGFKKGISMQNRIRTEERYLEETNTKPSSRILNINYRLSFTKPVSKKWDILLGDEYFEQVVSKKFGFNQNRIITAGICNINKTMQLQGGYIWVLRKNFSQHVVQFTLKKLILLYGKKDQKHKSPVSHLPEAE
jgi:hypothetical protein